jgi:SAM-dependent methyltransferase
MPENGRKQVDRGRSWRPRLHQDIASEYPFALKLEARLDTEALRTRLKGWEPWGHRVEFSNGLSTADLARRVPFSDSPLYKLAAAHRSIPFDQLRGKTVLDIGCNSGYNSIALAVEYGMLPVGIDSSQRHIDVSRFLSDIAGIEAQFLKEDAECFARPEAFDLVLHFGTLYHLQNPLLSLRVSLINLTPGGYFALETQCYENPVDANLCYFMHMHNNDPTNFWALSTHVLETCMRLMGFVEIKEIVRVSPPGLGQNMSRVVITARKPPI